MKLKNNESFLEIKTVLFDYKSLFKIFFKDSLMFISIIILIILFSATIKMLNPQLDITQYNWMDKSSEELEKGARILNFYFYSILLIIIIFFVLLLSTIILFKGWIWTGFFKEKLKLKTFWKLAITSLFMYFIIGVIAVTIIYSSSAFYVSLTLKGISNMLITVFAWITLILVFNASIHLINYQAYIFIKTKKVLNSVISPFASFSKIKRLIIPYLAIDIFFIVISIILNFLLIATTNTSLYQFMTIVSLLALILIFSFIKVYSFTFFERIYNQTKTQFKKKVN